MNIDMDVTSSVDELFEQPETADILDTASLEAHPADLHDVNAVVGAWSRQGGQVPAIFWEIDQRNASCGPRRAPAILHLQVAATDRIGLFDTMALSRNVHRIPRFECWDAVRDRMEMVVEIDDYAPWLMIDQSHAGVVTVGRKGMKQT